MNIRSTKEKAMNLKYQKPISRNLGDLAPAEGACNFGWEVAPICSIGSEYTLCAGGTEQSGAACVAVGRSATNCNTTGITAIA